MGEKAAMMLLPKRRRHPRSLKTKAVTARATLILLSPTVVQARKRNHQVPAATVTTHPQKRNHHRHLQRSQAQIAMIPAAMTMILPQRHMCVHRSVSCKNKQRLRLYLMVGYSLKALHQTSTSDNPKLKEPTLHPLLLLLLLLMQDHRRLHQVFHQPQAQLQWTAQGLGQ